MKTTVSMIVVWRFSRFQRNTEKLHGHSSFFAFLNHKLLFFPIKIKKMKNTPFFFFLFSLWFGLLLILWNSYKELGHRKWQCEVVFIYRENEWEALLDAWKTRRCLLSGTAGIGWIHQICTLLLELLFSHFLYGPFWNTLWSQQSHKRN